MNSFNTIFKRYLSQHEEDTQNIIDFINFAIIVTKSKFKFLGYILNNIFASISTKEQIFDIFYKTQKMYNGFAKLGIIYKLKRLRQYNSIDLLMNPIFKNSKNIMKIKQNDFLYLFTRRDLINLLNSSLSYSPNFFSNPLKCKNPYNNTEFSNACLYNIYYFLREGDIAISDLILAFYNCYFDLNIFIIYNEQIVRKYAIQSFIKNTNHNDLRTYILDMLYYYCPHIIIQNHFCNKILCDTMLNFVGMYLMITYSLDTKNNKRYLKKKLFDQLRAFKILNPTFGLVPIRF